MIRPEYRLGRVGRRRRCYHGGRAINEDSASPSVDIVRLNFAKIEREHLHNFEERCSCSVTLSQCW